MKMLHYERECMLSVEQTEDEKKEGNPLGGRKPAGVPAVLNPQDEKNESRRQR